MYLSARYIDSARKGNMDKTGAINAIIELQKQVGKALGGHAFESWQKLDVPVAQLKSLFIIANREETNFKMLARDLGVTSGNVTGIVDRLVEQGLVSRNVDREDRRVIRLLATEKGQELLDNLMETQSAHMSRILARLNPEELDSLFRGLSGLFRALKEHRKEMGDGINEHHQGAG